ncbi:hypothetical protein C9927_00970 [Pseudidiomarina aestuarii]|uniref:Calx-beta domain-containing protein n=2 Tax=Pseudidiomarina aestuarii TaxID=624146 RepID=A0A2T4D861_9GAMM|nr:hypothetical protein C9988_00820 [Pseudidiomarina aestuarii]PTB89990.1 hypothetical protein C9927_00970 [Pseudidiomarina aestuarii]PTB90372.1 hypothetical protein C9928_00265 [Pseudidiomarina aestuarii]
MTAGLRYLAILSLAFTLAACGSGERNTGGGDTGGDGGGSGSTPPTATASNVTVNEGNPNQVIEAAITVSLSTTANASVSFDYATADASGLAGTDYEDTSGTVTFTAGQSSQTITIPIISNAVFNDDRDFFVDFSNAQGLTLGTTRVQVTIVNDDPRPVLAFEQSIFETTEQAGTLGLTVTLSNGTESEVTFDLDVSGTATAGVDYSLEETSFTIPAGALEQQISLTLIADDVKEGGESVILAFANVREADTNPDLSTQTIVIRGDAILADTGAVEYYNSGDFSAATPDAEHPNQDADYGRDTTAAVDNNADGAGNLNLTKLDSSGNALPQNATSFSCVRDNLSGTVYAVWAEGDALSNFYFNPTYRYKWFNDDSTNNAGNPGTFTPESAFPAFPDENDPIYYENANCAFPAVDPVVQTLGCSSQNYTNYLNTIGYCGFDDWRLPTISELQSIAIYQADQSQDNLFFPDVAMMTPNGDGTVRLLSSTPAADPNSSAWCLEVQTARRMLCNKNDVNSIRAARNPVAYQE